jgi:cytochrome c oxidase subunit 2
MSYLRASGGPADETVGLLWGLSVAAVLVVLIVGLLVVLGVIVRTRGRQSSGENRHQVERTRDRSAMLCIYGGLALTTLVLLGFTAWTVAALASMAAPATAAAVTVDVTAHQWWWELVYSDGDPARTFETANEIYLPVGRPVLFRLHAGDVIHSFWIPALGGKTDLIPGQENRAWLRADAPGVYRGQCVEYCGLEHALMGLRAVAVPPDAFDAWWEHQLRPAAGRTGRSLLAGQQQFLRNCGPCHAVRGTEAGGEVGPDLTHLMSRATLAAETLPNTAGDLLKWIAYPQDLKPGTNMPNLDLPDRDFAAIRDYLLTLD